MVVSVFNASDLRAGLPDSPLERHSALDPHWILQTHRWTGRLGSCSQATCAVSSWWPLSRRTCATGRRGGSRCAVSCPSLGALPLAALMIWIAVAYGLRPLVRITQDLRKRSHRDLLPLDVSRLPPDIAPLAEALNDLMGRLAGIIATQRTFIADAAHELLTPLTALRLQAQMLARSKSPSRQQEAMAELQGGVSRTLQLARQLLDLGPSRCGRRTRGQDRGRSGNGHPTGILDPSAARDREGAANGDRNSKKCHRPWQRGGALDSGLESHRQFDQVHGARRPPARSACGPHPREPNSKSRTPARESPSRSASACLTAFIGGATPR